MKLLLEAISKFLPKANQTTIARLFNESLQIIWPKRIKYDSVLMILTDAAPYMKASANSLKVLYPRMIHLTCLAHGLHRIAETIRENYQKVDKLISNVKKFFQKHRK